MQALEIVRNVRQNLRRPTHQQLAQPTLLRAVSDCQKRVLRESQLSDRGWMEKFEIIRPYSNDEAVDLPGFSIPTRVEVRAHGQTDDDWITVPIVNHDGFQSVYDGVAFYGSPPRIAFSSSTVDVLTREYRVWYETSPAVINALDEDVSVADLFSDLLTDETTLYCIPLVENDAPEWLVWVKLQIALTSDRLIESRRQWKKWLNMSRDNNVVYSEGFRPGDCSTEAAFIGPDGYLRAS